MKIIFSKTDALGDQLFASGYVRQILAQARPDILVWFVRKGYEGISALFEGSRVFVANSSTDPKHEAVRMLTMAQEAPALPWGRVLFAPLPLDPYSAWPEDRDLCRELSWWFDFVEAIGVDIAITGTFDLNWVDQALVLASKAEKRVAVQAHRHSQVLPQEAVRILEARHVRICFTHTTEHDSKRHELDSFAELLRLTDGKRRVLGFDLDPTESISESTPIETCGPTILVAPGASDPKKTYPMDRMVEAIRLIRGSMDRFDLLILSGPKDAEIAESLLMALQAENILTRLLDLSGGEIPKLVRILREVSLLICNDTFVLHLASYLGTPTVAVWGGGHWGRFLPRSGRVTVLHIPMLCRPCNWFCCFSERHCLTDIGPTDVAKAALRRLETSRESSPFVDTVECTSSLTDEEVLNTLRTRSEELVNLQISIKPVKKWLDLEIEAKDKALRWAQEAEAMKVHWEGLCREAEKQRDMERESRLQEAAAKEKALRWVQEAEAMKVHWEGLFREGEKQRDMERELRLQEAAAKEKALDWANNAEAMKAHWEELFRMVEQERDKERDLRIQESAAKEAALKWAQDAESMKAHWEALFRAAESQQDPVRRQPQIKEEAE